MKKISVIICGMLMGVFLFCFFPTQADAYKLDQTFQINKFLDSNSLLIFNSTSMYIVDFSTGCTFSPTDVDQGLVINTEYGYPRQLVNGDKVYYQSQTCAIDYATHNINLSTIDILNVNQTNSYFVTESGRVQFRFFYSSGCSSMKQFAFNKIYLETENSSVDTEDTLYLLGTPNGWETCGISSVKNLDRSIVKKLRVKNIENNSAVLKWRNKSIRKIKYEIQR